MFGNEEKVEMVGHDTVSQKRSNWNNLALQLFEENLIVIFIMEKRTLIVASVVNVKNKVC